MEKTSRDWTFRIRDAYETDAGMLNSASINICTKNYMVEPNFELTNFVYIQIRIKISLFSLLVRQNLELK
jgi:hypothetical protein